MSCIECDMLKARKNLIFEDELSAAFLVEKPAAPGHVLVIPKQHFPIIEGIPDEVMSHIFFIANKISTFCFEIFKAHGTNMIIRNGVVAGQKTTHAGIYVLPRFENDGINLQWNTIKIPEDKMKSTENLLKVEIERENMEQFKEKENIKIKEDEHKKEFSPDEEIPEEENYMLRQLDRIP